jgi:hypothetical protein
MSNNNEKPHQLHPRVKKKPDKDLNENSKKSFRKKKQHN